MSVINVDLDGVIFDFSGGVVDMFGVPYEKLTKLQVSTLWNDVAHHRFFERLDYLPDSFDLVRAIHKSMRQWRFLTATGSSNFHEILRQKSKAVEGFLKKAGISSNISIAFCADGRLKKHYAPGILIDDREKSCDPWREAGGTAFLWPQEKEQALFYINSKEK